VTRTVLITGAGGFVGSHMAEGFLAMGDKVIALDAQFDPTTRLRLRAAELLEAPLTVDVLSPDLAVDLVVHGAAITTPPREFGLSDAEHVAANVALLDAALALATAHGATSFVFLSSSGVFAVEDGDAVHVESTIPTATSPYALAKRAGEDATSAANSALLRTLSVRLGPIYGPYEIARTTRRVVSRIRRWLDLVAADEPIVVQVPVESRDWTFAPDLPRALDALLGIEPAMSGIVHLTSGAIVSNIDLADSIASVASGAEIRVEPSGEAPRLPMRSDRIDLAALHAWTPLARGIAETYFAEVPQ
jgi:nucleoside-diphosphate-sugar epimerase